MLWHWEKTESRRLTLTKIEKGYFLKKYCTESKKSRKHTPSKQPKTLTDGQSRGVSTIFMEVTTIFNKIAILVIFSAGKKSLLELFFQSLHFFWFLGLWPGVYKSRYQVTKVLLIIRNFHLDFLTIRKFCQFFANKDFFANSLSISKFWQRSCNWQVGKSREDNQTAEIHQQAINLPLNY